MSEDGSVKIRNILQIMFKMFAFTFLFLIYLRTLKIPDAYNKFYTQQDSFNSTPNDRSLEIKGKLVKIKNVFVDR